MGTRARRPNGADIPLLEWFFALAGFALVFGTLAFIVYEGYSRGTSPPDITVEAESIAPVRAGFLVTLRASNRGATTAADVKVQGVLKGSSGTIETGEMTFQYLPPGSARRGGLFFANDPRRHELTLRATGYEAP